MKEDVVVNVCVEIGEVVLQKRHRASIIRIYHRVLLRVLVCISVGLTSVGISGSRFEGVGGRGKE